MEFDSDAFIIVGGVPDPVGGVTNYIYRLARKDKDHVKAVFDLYPSESKKDISPVCHVRPNRLPLLSLFFYLMKKNCDIYFNFSGVLGFLVVFLMPKRRGVRWFLTLHNGAIKERLESSRLSLFLAKLGARRVDQIGYLSSSQRQAFELLGVREENLRQVSSFIPINKSDIEPIDINAFGEVTDFLKQGIPYFVISGYPTKIYQHLEVLQVFERLWDVGHRMKLVAFWYGDDSEDILESLKVRFGESPHAQFYWGMGADRFLSVLSKSSGYIRMNTVDSFGVAVAEAVMLGVPAIASNVCSRYSGSETVDANDFRALEEFILRRIGQGREK